MAVRFAAFLFQTVDILFEFDNRFLLFVNGSLEVLRLSRYSNVCITALSNTFLFDESDSFK